MNDFFIEYIDRCRRRVLYNVSIKVVTWWLTIALSGIVFSFIIKKPVLIPACMAMTVIVIYYYYKRLPGNEDIVSIIDNSLSLKEGLITAFQFRENSKNRDSFVSPLIKQITTRLNVSRPALLFPLSFPKVLLVWPLLIIFLIFSGGMKNIVSGGISNNSGSFFSSVKEDVNKPVNPEEIKRMDSARTGDVKTLHEEAHLPNGLLKPEESGESKDLTQEGGQSSGKEISKETFMSGTLTKDENSPPLFKGGRGGVSSGESNYSGSPDSEKVSSISGENLGKDISKGKSVIVSGRGSGKNDLSTELTVGNGKWEAGQWKSSYTDAMHVLIQQDIPDDYKEYVRRYFDAVQREEQVNGR